MTANREISGSGWRHSGGLLVLSAVLCGMFTGCGAARDDGLRKYPAQGVVTINGKPVAGVVVRLIGASSAGAGANARFPVGVTDDQGVFRISTNGTEDGGVAGDYGVAVVWPENNEPPLRDRLEGAFSTPEKSRLRITISPGDNHFPPFELNFESKRRGRPSLRRE